MNIIQALGVGYYRYRYDANFLKYVEELWIVLRILPASIIRNLQGKRFICKHLYADEIICKIEWQN